MISGIPGIAILGGLAIMPPNTRSRRSVCTLSMKKPSKMRRNVQQRSRQQGRRGELPSQGQYLSKADLNGSERRIIESINDAFKEFKFELKEDSLATMSEGHFLASDLNRMEGRLKEDLKRLQGSRNGDLHRMEGSVKEDLNRMEGSVNEITKGVDVLSKITALGSGFIIVLALYLRFWGEN